MASVCWLRCLFQRLREDEARRQAAMIRMHADERRARLERLERTGAARHREAPASEAEGESYTARASTSGARTATDEGHKRPRLSEPQIVDTKVWSSSSELSPGRRERSDSTTAHEITGNTRDHRQASQSRTGHRYGDSDGSSESDDEIMTAAAKARARRKAAGGKRRARSAMFI